MKSKGGVLRTMVFCIQYRDVFYAVLSHDDGMNHVSRDCQ